MVHTIQEISSDDESGQEQSANNKSRLVYKHKSGIVELHEDCLNCLSGEKYLKDTVIQFFIAYLLDEKCNATNRERIHIFDSIFHNQLVKTFVDEAKSVDQNRVKQLSKWFEGVDIFKKDFLIFPVCFQDHWFTIIVCYPYYVHDVDRVLKNIRNNKTKSGGADLAKEACVIVMDSLGTKDLTNSLQVRDFLDHEWRSRNGTIKQFSHHNLTEYHPSLPKQTNAFDCGVYLLSYMQTFIEQPDEVYDLARKLDRESQSTLKSKVNKFITRNGRESLKILIKKVCQSL